jgi:polyhydroxyalkanoate synthesis regulator phasin
MKRKILAPLAVTGALAAGGLAVAVVNPLSAVSAQSTTASTTASTTGARQGPLQRALDELVEKGTLTQAQADAVRDAVKAQAEVPKGGRHAAAKLRAIRGAARIAADTIGIEPQQLRSELRSGRSIAEIAVEHGKTAQDVIDAIVAAGNERIDQAVADGRLTAEQAAKAKDRIAKGAEKLVNRTPHRGGD